MRRCGWLALLPIVLLLPSGCVWMDGMKSTSFVQRFRDRSISPDQAVIQVAAIYRPLGDGYINGRVWECTNELIPDLERHVALDENGFRIGQMIGSPPIDLQQLLLDPQVCIMHARIFPQGKPTPLFINETPAPKTAFEIVVGKQKTPVEFTEAKYCLEVVAEFPADGRTKLTFTPKVEHGETVLPFQALPNQSKWTKTIDRAAQRYPELSWQVTLEQNQCLLIGGRPDRLHTLGLATFSHPVGTGVQQLFVIRNCRSASALENHENNVEQLIRADKTPPLALQAAMPVYRFQMP